MAKTKLNKTKLKRMRCSPDLLDGFTTLVDDSAACSTDSDPTAVSVMWRLS